MATETDRIEREVTIAATPERVWEVITGPEHVGTWFGTGDPISIDLRSGGEMVLDHGSNGSYRTVIVEVDPPHKFSFRWAEGYPDVLATEASSTLIEFTVTPISKGQTRLAVVESGFDSLVIPENRGQGSYEEHNAGWSVVIGKAAAYAEGRDTTPMLAHA